MQLRTEETGYRLIFEGKIAGNQDKDVVLKKVAEIYGKQPDEVQKLFSGKRIVIKKNTSLSVCKKIAKRFNIVGAICSIETINQSEEAVHDAGEKPESQLISIKNHKDFENTGNMHYSEIIKKITEDLTGNVVEDIDYLLKARDQYINHRFSIEICRAIGRLLYRILPNDKKEEIEKYFEKLNLSTDILLNDAKDKLAAGDLDGAEKIVISIIPDDNYFPEDNASIYFSFKNLFEFYLFQHLYNPEKKFG